VVALRKQRAPEVAAFLSDSDPLVVAEAASAIHDDTSIPAALPALAALLHNPTHHERTLRRALSAALRLRSPEQAARVASFASNNTAPKHLRLVALNILNTWPNPPVLDTVEGRHRPLPKISASTIAPAVTESLTTLLDDSDKDIAKAARAAASTYGIGTDPAELLAIVKADNPETAPDALRLLATHPAKQKEAAKLALESTHEIIRAEALRALASTDPEKFITIASAFLADENILESRAVFEGLDNLNHPDAGKILITALPAIRSMEIPAELRLDALEAARASKVPAVIKALAEYNATPTKDDLIAYTGTLYGGNPVNGEDLFNNHIAAQCIRCHSTDAGGSTVGPNLGKIGAKDPRFLLESLVLPSKAIAPGYGLLSITLKDGDSLAGTLMEQTPHALTIRLADQSTRKISRADIATQTPPVSSMPPMNLLLTKKELRDVLAYLQSLK
jgi:putative heme-binding domain-containing protein